MSGHPTLLASLLFELGGSAEARGGYGWQLSVPDVAVWLMSKYGFERKRARRFAHILVNWMREDYYPAILTSAWKQVMGRKLP